MGGVICLGLCGAHSLREDIASVLKEKLKLMQTILQIKAKPFRIICHEKSVV